MIRVFGNWAIVSGVAAASYGIFGLLFEGFFGISIESKGLALAAGVPIFLSIIFCELTLLIRATIIWKKAGGDDRIRKVVLCGTPKFLNCWEYDGMIVSSVSYPPRVIFRSVNGKWRKSIEFDSLSTKLIYQRKMNEFIKLREALE